MTHLLLRLLLLLAPEPELWDVPKGNKDYTANWERSEI